jgi:hypothetical protein
MNTTKKTKAQVIEAKHINQVKIGFEGLLEASAAFRDSLIADEGLPLYLPELKEDFPDLSDAMARKKCAEALTVMWHEEPGNGLPRAGIVCSSVATINAAERLNEAKSIFKSAVLEIREQDDGKNKSSMERYVTSMLKDVLATVRINRIHLLNCYKAIRILEPGLCQLTWTWAQLHSSIKNLSFDEAIELINSEAPDEQVEYFNQLLAQVPSNLQIVRKKPISNQLRANVVYGERRRKMVTVSGVMLTPDPKLPLNRIKWKKEPIGDAKHAEKRLTRCDSVIPEDPYIEILHLYLAPKKVSIEERKDQNK